jgi:hypothetical protein
MYLMSKAQLRENLLMTHREILLMSPTNSQFRNKGR